MNKAIIAILSIVATMMVASALMMAIDITKRESIIVPISTSSSSKCA